MTYFYLQTFLLLILAYMLGALAGCFMRKFFPADHMTSPRPADRVTVPAGVGRATIGAAAGAAVATAGSRLREKLAGRAAGEVTPTVPSSTPTSRAPRQIDIPPVSSAAMPIPERPIVSVPPVSVPPVTTSGISTESTTHIGQQASGNMTWEHERQQNVSQTSDSDFLTEKRDDISSYATHVSPFSDSQQADDDLSRIIGVGSILALKLKKIGITRFEQIAKWEHSDILNINEQMEFSGRIEREDWIGQARRLMSGEEAVIDGTTAEVDPRHHKSSVENFPSAESAGKLDAVSSLSLPVSGGRDDLKRIAGIGIVLEEQLNQMGYTHYVHIRNLTPYDIRKISERLEFTGRIEREDWMGQAQRLEKA